MTTPAKHNTRKRKRFVGGALYWVFAVVIFAIALTGIYAGDKLPGGWRVFSVQSGSMEPAISTGSLVFVRPSGSYAEGDVITFLSEPDADARNQFVTTTHRVVEITEVDGSPVFTTKGDANNANDAETVQAPEVLGKSVGHVPYLGYPVAYAKTQAGFIMLIVIPATLIIYSELVHIKRGVAEMSLARKKKKDAKHADDKPLTTTTDQSQSN